MDRTSLAIVRLRENAVPSIFTEYPAHLQPTETVSESYLNDETFFLGLFF